jgi:acyl-CoA reductase-like NAD-dependent aldehyde dehydrogenase
MLINGEWVASKSAKTFPVYDPSTEDVIAQVPDANADDVNRAVAAGQERRLRMGRGRPRRRRSGDAFSFAWPRRCARTCSMLAELECRNSGKPIVEAEYDIQ